MTISNTTLDYELRGRRSAEPEGTAADPDGQEDSTTETTGSDPATDIEERRVQSVKLKLAVLMHQIGKPLDTDVYYGSKLIARRGQPVSGTLVLQLRGCDPRQLHFTNDGVRRLGMD